MDGFAMTGVTGSVATLAGTLFNLDPVGLLT
jgi:hypothetical protein